MKKLLNKNKIAQDNHHFNVVLDWFLRLPDPLVILNLNEYVSKLSETDYQLFNLQVENFLFEVWNFIDKAMAVFKWKINVNPFKTSDFSYLQNHSQNNHLLNIRLIFQNKSEYTDIQTYFESLNKKDYPDFVIAFEFFSSHYVRYYDFLQNYITKFKNYLELKNNRKLKYQKWQTKISKRLHQVINWDLQKQDINNINFDNIITDSQDVNSVCDFKQDNNLIYALPKIIAYIYDNLGDGATKLLISLWKCYTVLTWNNLFGIDFLSLNKLPVNFKSKIVWVNYEEDKLDLFLLWELQYLKLNEEFVKQGILSELSGKKKFINLLLNSSLYRRKLIEHLDNLAYISELEYLRSLVKKTYEIFPNTQYISWQQWSEYLKQSTELMQQANEEFKYSEKQLERLICDLKKIDKMIQKNISREWKVIDTELNKDLSIQKNQLVYQINILKKWFESRKQNENINSKILEQISKTQFSQGLDDNKTRIIDNINIVYYKDKINELKSQNDFVWLEFLYLELFGQIFRVMSRFHVKSSDNDKQDALPKNFINNNSYTCFSWVWMIASILIKSWIQEKDIYIVDDSVSSQEDIYRHSFLIVRVWEDFYKLDYGWLEIQKMDIEISKHFNNIMLWSLRKWMPASDYYLTSNVNWLWRMWRVYKLTDWIIMQYLTNLIWIYLEEEKLELADKFIKIALCLDYFSSNLYELIGIFYIKQNNYKKALPYFKKCFEKNWKSMISVFYIWENYYKQKQYEKALLQFEKFMDNIWYARKPDEQYILKVQNYISKISKKLSNEKSNYDIMFKFLKTGKNYLDRESQKSFYFLLSDQMRKNLITEVVKVYKEFSSNIVLQNLCILIKWEVEENTDLKTLNLFDLIE